MWTYARSRGALRPADGLALIAALVWPRATPQAGTMSIAAGMLMTLLWELVALWRGTATTPLYPLGIQTIYPALLASVGTLVFLTLNSGAAAVQSRESAG